MFLGAMALSYAMAVLGMMLPVLALLCWRVGRHRRAGILGISGLILLAISAGPALLDEIRFRYAAGIMRQTTITRSVPDLTGKTVAYVSGRSFDDVSLDCEAILRHSGAAVVYMIEPFHKDRAGGPPPDLTGPLDLTALVSARAALADTPPGYDNWPVDGRDRPFCSPAPLNAPAKDIDYFVMRGGNYDGEAPFEQELAGLDHERFHPQLEWYFAPVADPAQFRIAAARADLLRMSMSAHLAGYPWLFGPSDLRDLPARPGRDPEVLAALCRDRAEDCRFE